jgi:hypothetical protein
MCGGFGLRGMWVRQESMPAYATGAENDLEMQSGGAGMLRRLLHNPLLEAGATG